MSTRLTIVGIAAVSIAATMLPHGWSAKLQPTGPSGNVTVEAPTPEQAKVSIALTAGKPASEYPWHIHSGSCETGGPVVGGGASYTALKVATDSTAKGDAVIRTPLDGNQDYHVNVHRSKENMSVISCGDLKLETTK